MASCKLQEKSEYVVDARSNFIPLNLSTNLMFNWPMYPRSPLFPKSKSLPNIFEQPLAQAPQVPNMIIFFNKIQ
jgi:hypothetical protein